MKIPSLKDIKRDSGCDLKNYKKELKNNSGAYVGTLPGEKVFSHFFSGFKYLVEDGCQFSLKNNILQATRGTFRATIDLSGQPEYFRDTILAIVGLKEAPIRPTTKQIDLYKYIRKNSRDGYGGVKHQNGMRIATNGMVFCAIQDDYDPKLEGKVINHLGQDYDYPFPAWENIMPSEKGLTALDFDWNSIRKQIKLLQIQAKATYKILVLKIKFKSHPEHWFIDDQLIALLEYLRFYPETKVYMVKGLIDMLMAVSVNGNRGLFAVGDKELINKKKEMYYIGEIS